MTRHHRRAEAAFLRDPLGYAVPAVMCGRCLRGFRDHAAFSAHHSAVHAGLTEQTFDRLLVRYFTDPAFAEQIDTETASNRARANAAIDAAVRRNHPWAAEGEMVL